ncbi:MAG: hypothetical protein LBP87_08895, partial [Planctomycetaceae bacterium]|nr:hypothetical protein [Planctomycetaceae bacterium]
QPHFHLIFPNKTTSVAMNFPQNKPHYLIVKIQPVNFVNEVACVLYLWLLRLFCLGKLGRNEVVVS